MSILELEKLRKKVRNIYVIGIIITIILSIVINSKSYNNFRSLVFLGIIITCGIGYFPSKKFSLEYKKFFVLKSLDNIFDNLIYEPKRGLDKSIIVNTEMIYMGNSYFSDDYISGRYKNINFIQADVYIKNVSKIRFTKGTIFKGKWLVFDFNKKFKAKIMVKEKEFYGSKVGNLSSHFSYKKIRLENYKLGDKFDIYAQNEHEAFYILTPSLIGKMESICNRVPGKLIFCFTDNKLHVGINNNRSSFEHNVFFRINEEKAMNEVINNVKLITDFVLELNLNNDLFKR